MSYTAPADLPTQWHAKADELETGIEARTLRECADALAESLYANASAYLDRLGIPALGRPVEGTSPATPPVSPPCTCGHPRSDHAYYADGCWPDNGFDHCTCRTYTTVRPHPQESVTMAHNIARTKVDVSSSRPHEIAQASATVVVGVWCECGRRVQGTAKIHLDHVLDDDLLRQAVEDAQDKATIAHTNHAESETP